VGRNPKEPVVQVASRRKEIADDQLPNSALENLAFEWSVRVPAASEDRLCELTDYRKIHGHCNVPRNYSENSKLARWVAKQKIQYRSHLEGKTSSMTAFRIQALERLGFEWDSHGAAWEDRLSELADYSKI
jgi:hypothetical protein